MESLPSRPEPQRRASPRDSSSEPPQQEQAGPSGTSNAQRVVLSPGASQSPRASSSTTPKAAQASSDEDEWEPRKCWICFNDETEDDETTSEWRSPCPCVLVAHEQCLLDWIADMEAPNSRRVAGSVRGKILCPQCKSEIKIQRPRSWVVDAVRKIERTTNMMLLPGVILFAGTAGYTALSLVGRLHIYSIFGPEDAVQILGPLYEAPYFPERSVTAKVLHNIAHHWRLHLGLPLIPTILMASRSTIADSVLPFLPFIFFVSSGRPQDDMMNITWPPSAAFTIATLPMIRGIYNAYYERVWRPREQQWLKEIQPRAGSEPEPEPEPQAGFEIGFGRQDEVQEDGVIEDVLEVEVDFDIFADWNGDGGDGDNNAVDNPPAPPAHPLHAPPQDEPPIQAPDQAAPAPNVPQQPAVPRRRGVRRERQIPLFSTTSLADTILGALVFPHIAAAVGEALKYVLPASWVVPPKTRFSSAKPTGFLQTRWGRSILGGCLFVGMKDMVMLYVRWKMAQNHRKRGILDYDGKKGPDKAKRRSARA